MRFQGPPGSCSRPSHPSPVFRRVLSSPSHLSPGLEMRLEEGALRLPKRRRCLLEAPGVGAPGSSPRPRVPAPPPCLAPQAPRAPLGGPPCIHPCTHPGPAPPGRREQRHPQAPAVASGEPRGGVVSTPSATASWAPLAFTGARCRVRAPWGCGAWGHEFLGPNRRELGAWIPTSFERMGLGGEIQSAERREYRVQLWRRGFPEGHAPSMLWLIFPLARGQQVPPSGGAV